LAQCQATPEIKSRLSEELLDEDTPAPKSDSLVTVGNDT